MHQIPGTISVFAVAGDGSLSLVQTVAAPPRQMIVTPDGSRLIEWDDYGLVVSYPIRSDGSLGAALPNPSVTGSARALGMTLDGRTLYIATYPQQIQQYAITSDGALTAQDPADVGIYGCRADFLGVTPDGTQLDATCYSQGITMSLAPGGGLTFNGGLFTGWGGSPTVEDVRGRALYKAIYPNALEHMQRQLDGSLADFPTPLIFDAARITGIAADPGGTLLAVATAANSLETYAIAADGSLSGPIASIPTTLNGLSMLTYAPDQPPVATLSATPDGRTVMFDASASTPATGTIARYDWTFGDGTVLADGGPTPSHAYASVGAYTATVHAHRQRGLLDGGDLHRNDARLCRICRRSRQHGRPPRRHPADRVRVTAADRARPAGTAVHPRARAPHSHRDPGGRALADRKPGRARRTRTPQLDTGTGSAALEALPRRVEPAAQRAERLRPADARRVDNGHQPADARRAAGNDPALRRLRLRKRRRPRERRQGDDPPAAVGGRANLRRRPRRAG